jgi:hypothetical protein
MGSSGGGLQHAVIAAAAIPVAHLKAAIPLSANSGHGDETWKVGYGESGQSQES